MCKITNKAHRPENSVRDLHGARGPVVGPHWYSLSLISALVPKVWVTGQYVAKSVLQRSDLNPVY